MSEDVLRKAIEDGWLPQSDAELRLSRRIQWVVEAVHERISDDVQRALLGVEAVAPEGRPLSERIRLAVAASDGGAIGDVATMNELEEEAQVAGEPALVVPAARLHVRVNVGREASARMSLSDQSLPYVFPGDVHPLMVEALACGDRVLPALHVDWLRKLTAWLAPALSSDCNSHGLWFWPVLDVLDAKKLGKELKSMVKVPMKPGARGLAAAYGSRIAVDIDPGPDPMDQCILALAVVGNAAG